MKKTIQISSTRCDECAVNGTKGGLPVRANLCVGPAWDDLDDEAKELWSSWPASLLAL